jgi:hypothetical protein
VGKSRNEISFDIDARSYASITTRSNSARETVAVPRFITTMPPA